MEYTDFHNGRIVRRRIMEAKGGAQVRRLQILYFLSRNGCNEHPHLIRIHHLSNNGVRLRDIKRWLGELRGKDMPESFAWSYKRTYKAGYVWQDILDDDLVTPISDNEYVIKGSEILSTNHNIEISTHRQKPLQDSSKDMQIASPTATDIHSSDSSNYASSETPSVGSQTSTSADDSVNHILEESSHRSNREAVSNQKKRKTNKLEIISIKGIRKTAATSDKPHHRKSRSGGLFRNFISCGGVDTNDSVVVMASQWYKPLLKTCSGNSADGVRDPAPAKEKPHVAWPLYGPNCSQCGKTFKPEKLQSHMNSCKGMKALAKAKSTSSRNEDSVSAYLPTHKS
ncbi:protein SOSEKI 1-like isoform X1 [Salvia hispanica]|uniref:protein SOSEKI 1-like isoform X1 n=1 Tax=Salvia hispanica TaxID=49212 RepID=UPI0020090AF5|nr:protein SOSEKI 1-like isoform X1 [Salvia hispanica]XP_047983181.1 protein SOSEKI 1-like isoform X1 [Salvia hispanica]